MGTTQPAEPGINLVFCHPNGPAHVVSLMGGKGAPIQETSDTVGHTPPTKSGTRWPPNRARVATPGARAMTV